METSTKPTYTQENKLHFLDYWRIIRIRKTIIVAVFLLILLTTIAVTFYLPVSYASTARMRVEKDTPDISLVATFGGAQQAYDPYWLLTEFEVIQSKKILYPVITNLKLNMRYAERFKQEGEMPVADCYELLSKEVEIKQFRNTSIIEVRALNPTAKMASEIANAIANEYMSSRNSARNERASRGLRTLTNEMELLDQSVTQARKDVTRWRKELNIPEIGIEDARSITTDPQKISQLESMRTDAEAKLVAANEMLSRLRGKSSEELLPLLTASALGTPELNGLVGRLNDARQTLASYLTDFGPNHSNVKRAKALITEIEEQRDAQVIGIVAAQEILVGTYSATVSNISNKLAEVTRESARKEQEYAPYFTARRHLDDQLRLQSILKSKKWAEKLDADISKSSSVEVIQWAESSKRPVKPNKTLNIALGTMVGLLVGVGLAFFIEYLDTSVKTIDDVEQALQAPVLGVIPQNVGALINEGVDSPHAEAYRVLRTNVLFSRKDPNLRALTVVSGGAGEGKSTTILNLATVFAQQGNRVLVVDSDLRRPSIHKILNVANTVGLTNYLLSQNKLEEVIQTTKLPFLDFLPSGKLPSSSMGILNSIKMKEFIQEVKARYDFVFFDSPPIMGVSDASVLASEVDMSILVVQYRKYPQQMTLRAKQMVEKVGGRLLGVVLNNINISQDSYYYYYSGYYYDYYSKNEDSKVPSEKKSAGSKAGAAEAKQSLDLKQKY